MFTRIVKMEFQPEKINDFVNNFNKEKEYVRKQPGCHSLVLYRDKVKTNVFFTYSTWESESDLENYRNSEFFKGVWSFTKQLFNAKPMAWSVDEVTRL
jgi:quinol monooxygenase YgiN